MTLRLSLITLTTLLATAALAAPVTDQSGLDAQVALDVAGFSPGVIDGKMGKLAEKALRGFQEARGLPVTGSLDPATKAALGSAPGTRAVTLTTADAAGPFVKSIPSSMAAQARLTALHYTGIEEALAEKYHTTPATLRTLHPGVSLAAGAQIIVPAVAQAEALAVNAPAWDATLVSLSIAKTQPRAARVVVDKSEQYVRAYDAAGGLIAQFPATLGSLRDPLPLGEWKVGGVSRLPPFNYNPDLFWDAAPKDKKAKLPPGPNGPVGVVWIDLSKEHYGIHGTPRPETISRTESHGCIRLTNWDAARLAQMVEPGTPITLQE